MVNGELNSLNHSELLGAYVAQDVSPEERTAVETLLAKDAALASQHAQLKELIELLKQGDRPVSMALTKSLSDAVRAATTSPLPSLLGASVGQDISAAEKDQLQSALRQSPQAAKEEAALRATAERLKKGALPVSPELSQQLATRLAAKLPPAAMKPSAKPVDANTSSLRVYVAVENPWLRAAKWAGAAAATVLIGVATWQAYATRPTVDVATPNKNATEIVKTYETPVGPRNNETPGVPDHVVPAPTPTQIPDKGSSVEPPVIVKNDETKAPGSVNPITPTLEPKKDVGPIVEAPKTPDVAPRETPAPREGELVKEEPTKTPEPKNEPTPPEIVRQNPTKELPRNSPGGGGGTYVENRPKTSLTPGGIEPPSVRPTQLPNPNDPPKEPTTDPNVPDPNAPILPMDGKAVVGVTKENTVSVTTGGVTYSAAQRKVIDMPSSIATDQGRIALVLPSNGRLWLHRLTTVLLGIDKLTTTVELDAPISGEVAYQAPPGGKLKVTVKPRAGSAVTTPIEITSDGREELDIRFEPDRMTIVGESTVALSGAKKKTKVGRGMQLVWLVGSQEFGKSETAVPFFAWHADMTLPGEAVDPEKAPTEDKKPTKVGKNKKGASVRANASR